jgi:hypothetical protein
MMVRSLALAVVTGVLALTQLHATDATVPASEIRALVHDVTITGRYNNGDSYSEYHAPDGRVLGHNRRRENSGSCWDIRDDTVCYYYPVKDKAPNTFCWQFHKIGDSGIKAVLVKPISTTEIIGVLQSGNPHGHSDSGKPWSCEPLSSQKMTPRAGIKRLAAR